MTEFQIRLPKYLHLPRQVLWFDITEAGMILIFYMIGVIFEGLFWALILVGPMVVIPFKRKKPRGYFSHLMYEYGFKEIKGYPEPTAKEFNE